MTSNEALNFQISILDIDVGVARALKLYNIYCSRFGYHFRHDLNAYLIDNNGCVLKTIPIGEWECSREDVGTISRTREDDTIEEVDASSRLICGPRIDVRSVGAYVEELTRNEDFNVWLLITGTTQFIRTAPCGVQASGGVCCSKYWDRAPFPMPDSGEWIALPLGNPWIDKHPPETYSTHILTLQINANDLQLIAANVTNPDKEQSASPRFERNVFDENGLLYEKLKCNAIVRKIPREASIMSFQRNMTIERMIEELDMRALVLVSLEDILSLAIEFPVIFLKAGERGLNIKTIETVNGKSAITNVALYNEKHLLRRYPNRKLPRIHITSRVTEFRQDDLILVCPKKAVTATN